MRTFGTYLKQLRSLKRMNQSNLARKAKVTQGYISKIERNQLSPQIYLALAILKKLKSDLGEFQKYMDKK